MKTNALLLPVVVVLVGLSTPVFGHHSTSMFNMGQPATLEATVKSFEWKNPRSTCT